MAVEDLEPGRAIDVIAQSPEAEKFKSFEVWLNGVKRVISVPVQAADEYNAALAYSIISIEPGDRVSGANSAPTETVVDGAVDHAEKGNSVSEAVSNCVVIDEDFEVEVEEESLTETNKQIRSKTVADDDDDCEILFSSVQKRKTDGSIFGDSDSFVSSNLTSSTVQTVSSGTLPIIVNDVSKFSVAMPNSIASGPLLNSETAANTQSWVNERRQGPAVNFSGSESSNLLQMCTDSHAAKPTAACQVTKSPNVVVASNFSDPFLRKQGFTSAQSSAPSHTVYQNVILPVQQNVTLQQQFVPGQQLVPRQYQNVSFRQQNVPLQRLNILQRQQINSLQQQNAPLQCQNVPVQHRNVPLQFMNLPLRQQINPLQQQQNSPLAIIPPIPLPEVNSSTLTPGPVRKVKITKDINGSCIISVDDQQGLFPNHLGLVPAATIPSDVLARAKFANSADSQTLHTNVSSNPINNGRLQIQPSNVLVNYGGFNFAPSGRFSRSELLNLTLPQSLGNKNTSPVFVRNTLNGTGTRMLSANVQLGCTNNVFGAIHAPSSFIGSTSVGNLPARNFSSVPKVTLKDPYRMNVVSSAGSSNILYVHYKYNPRNRPVGVPIVPVSGTSNFQRFPCMLNSPVVQPLTFTNRPNVSVVPNSSEQAIGKEQNVSLHKQRHNCAVKRLRCPVPPYPQGINSNSLNSFAGNKLPNHIMTASSDSTILCNKIDGTNLRNIPVSDSLTLPVNTVSAFSNSIVQPLASSLLVSSASSWITPLFPAWIGSNVSKSGGSSLQPEILCGTVTSGSSPVATVASVSLPLPASHISGISNFTPSISFANFHQSRPNMNMSSNSFVQASTLNNCTTSSLSNSDLDGISELSTVARHSKGSCTSIAHSTASMFMDSASELLTKQKSGHASNESKKNKKKLLKHRYSDEYSSSDFDASESEVDVSSSDSWASDDSVTIGKRRRRGQTKNKKYTFAQEEDKGVHNSRTKTLIDHDEFLKCSCFVSLENLLLNGNMTVNLSQSLNGLVCCNFPKRKLTISSEEFDKSALLKNSYKQNTAVNYVSDSE